MMKNRLWYTVILLVLLMVCCFGTAMAAHEDTVLFSGINENTARIKSVAAEGDTLYIFTDDCVLYHFKLGMAQPEIVAQDIPYNGYTLLIDEFNDYVTPGVQSDPQALDYIFLKDDQLYNLNTLTGDFSTVAIADGMISLTPIVTLNLTPTMEDDTIYGSIALLNDAVFTGDTLYLLITNFSADSRIIQTLAAYSLPDGQVKVYTTPHIISITPYLEGSMLVAIFDEESAYESLPAVYPELHVLDLATDTTEKVAAFDTDMVAGIRYQPDNDALYFFSDGNIMMMPSLGTAQPVAYIPPDTWVSDHMNCSLLEGNLYVAASHQHIFIKNTDSAFLPTTTLNIYGGYYEDATLSFCINNPDVAVNFSPTYRYDSSQALLQALVSEENAPDILILDTVYDDFESLLKNGSFLDLSSNQVLASAANSMYPFIQDTITAHGKTYGIPLAIYQQTHSFSYSTDALAAAGLSPEDLPTNYIALCEFITHWNNELVDKCPDMQPFYLHNKEALFRIIVQDYLAYYNCLDENITFDTPMFRSLMEALGKMETSNLNFSEDERWHQTDLIQYLEADGLYNNTYAARLPMSLSPDIDTSSVGYALEVAFINPNSENVDAAITYLESCLEYMNDYYKLMLRPDWNQPILSQEDYLISPETIAYYNESIVPSAYVYTKCLQSAIWTRILYAFMYTAY